MFLSFYGSNAIWYRQLVLTVVEKNVQSTKSSVDLFFERCLTLFIVVTQLKWKLCHCNENS